MPSRRLLLLAFLGLAAACGKDGPGPDAAPRARVFVSVLPQAKLTERIGGPHVDVDVLVGPGQSPHAFEPTPKQLARLGEAKVFFRIGAPFEDVLLPKVRAAHPDLEIVDVCVGVAPRWLEDPGEAEAHGEEAPGAGEEEDGHGGHGHGGRDPHVWLDPRNLAVIAANTEEALARIDPAHAGDFAANRGVFQEALGSLDRRLAETLKPLAGREVFVFHPAFGYFTDRYGMRQVAVETGGREPSARQLASLVERARASGVRVIFVQPQFSPKSAQALAEAVGAAVVPLDPLAPDALESLETMAAALREGLSR